MKRWEPIAFPGPDNAAGAATHRNFNQSTGERGSWPDGLGYQQMIDELCAVVEGAGFTLDGTKSDQLLHAIRSGALNWQVVAGTANGLTVDFTPNLVAYTPGLPLRLITGGNANTGAMTINVDGLGNKALLRRGGGAMVAGDVPAASLIEVVYDGTAFRCVAPVQSELSVSFASNPEVAAGLVTGKAIHPAGLFSLPKSHNPTGYQMLPGGLYMQWGLVDPVAAAALTPVTFPIEFPTAAFQVMLTDRSDVVGNTDQVSVRTTGFSKTGFTIVNDESPTSVSWFAIGV